MRKSLGKLAEKGGPPADDVLARVSVVDELVPADLMIEAVVEDAEVKEDIFRRADGVLPRLRCSHRTRLRSRSVRSRRRPAGLSR